MEEVSPTLTETLRHRFWPQPIEIRDDPTREPVAADCEWTTTASRGAALLDPELAQHSKVVRTREFLSESDAQVLFAAAQEHQEEHKNDFGWYGGKQRGKLYLQHRGLAANLQPIVERIKEHVQRIDRECWGVLADMAGSGELEPRCVEFHQYNDNTKLECPNHVDTGSLFTADVMLSQEGIDFEGAELLTTQASEGEQLNITRHKFDYLDCLVFLSHKYHSVAPLRSGQRTVLVIEFWQNGECTGNHRCDETNEGVICRKEPTIATHKEESASSKRTKALFAKMTPQQSDLSQQRRQRLAQLQAEIADAL